MILGSPSLSAARWQVSEVGARRHWNAIEEDLKRTSGKALDASVAANILGDLNWTLLGDAHRRYDANHVGDEYFIPLVDVFRCKKVPETELSAILELAQARGK